MFSFKVARAVLNNFLNKYKRDHPTIPKNPTAQMDDGCSDQTKCKTRALRRARSSSSEAEIDRRQLVVGRVLALNLQPATSNEPNPGFMGFLRSRTQDLYPWLVF